MWLIVAFLPVAVPAPSVLAPKTCENRFLQLFLSRLCLRALAPRSHTPYVGLLSPLFAIPWRRQTLNNLSKVPGKLWGYGLSTHSTLFLTQTEGPEGCPQPSPYSVHVGITNSFGVMLGRSSQEIQAVKDWVGAVQSPPHFSNSLDKGCSQIVSFMTLRMVR